MSNKFENGSEALEILNYSHEAESKGEKEVSNPLDILRKIKENTLTTEENGSGFGEKVDLVSALEEPKKVTKDVKSEDIAVIEDLPEASFFINVFDVVISNGIYAVKKFLFKDDYCKPEDFSLPSTQLNKLTKAFQPLYDKYKMRFSIEVVFVLAILGAYGGRTLFATAEGLKRKEKDLESKKVKKDLETSENTGIEKPVKPKTTRKSRAKTKIA